MAPKLYMIQLSPPARAVLMCAKELDVDLELVELDMVGGDHLKEDYLKKNPSHTVPTLEDEDGFVLCDSHAIMGYLVAKYGKTDALYPKDDYKQRAIIDERLHFDSSALFGRVAAISKPFWVQNRQPTQEKLDNLRDALQVLERLLTQNKTDYVAGDNLSIADFSIFTTVGYINNFLPIAGFPNIVKYIERIQILPCQEVNEGGAAIAEAGIRERLKI